MARTGCRVALIGLLAAALLRPALAEPPKFQADPTWPQVLPNNWIIGTIGGITVDAQDRVGHQLGEFYNLHFIGIDSKGNVYSAEVQGKRVQKFRNLGGL